MAFIITESVRKLFVTVYGRTVYTHGVLTSDAFYRNVMVKIVLIRHVYTLVGYGDAGIPFFFFSMNQDFLYNVGMAGCACTVGEMNAMVTVVFLNEIVSGVVVRSLSGQPLPKVIVHHYST